MTQRAIIATLIVLLLLALGLIWNPILRSGRNPATTAFEIRSSQAPGPVASVTTDEARKKPQEYWVPSKPGTWVLWSVKETYNTETLRGNKLGPPSRRLEWPVETDLDRAACELVRQSEIRAAQQDRDVRPTADGAIAHYEREMLVESFYCVAVPKFPPGHNER